MRTLDSRLSEPVRLHCIGGFVVTMQFGISRTTADIGVLPTIPHEIFSRVEQIAGSGSELHRRFKVCIQPVGIATCPENYSSRLTRMWPGFKLEHLRLHALDAHDLALTKLERNRDVDRQDVQSLADGGYLDPGTLHDRYVSELRPNLLSGAEKHDLTLKLWIEMCWPKAGEG